MDWNDQNGIKVITMKFIENGGASIEMEWSAQKLNALQANGEPVMIKCLFALGMEIHSAMKWVELGMECN